VSYPWLIWTDPRTAGTAFSAALKAISEHPSVEDECFQYGPKPKQFANIYENWCIAGDPSALYRLLADHVLLKHIPEAFDDNFNADLARAAEYNGYRHIRLVRCNTFARLVSRGVAEQIDAWRTDAKSIVAGLKPLDVIHLVEDMRLDAARWHAVSRHITSCLVVRTEDLISRNRERRHACFGKVLRYLELPRSGGMEILDRTLERSGQHTESAWPLLPNLGELRVALAAEGAA
jgi:hypothetical protein